MGLISRVSSRTYRRNTTTMSEAEEEKAAELEVLESIYEENYNISSSGKTFSVLLKAEEDDDEHADRQKEKFGVESLGNFALRIKFNHPENYPDEALNYNLEHVDEDGDEIQLDEGESRPEWIAELGPLIDEQIEENLGMQQAFIVTSFIQDFLTDTCNELNGKRQERIYELQEEADNAHIKKLVGTPVTLETFTQWQIKFQLEMKQIYEAKVTEQEKAQAGRMTGKSLFANKLVNEDEPEFDEEFLDEPGEKITVDEALFGEDDLEDLDDLDLSDEDDSEEESDEDMR